ncbi:hypothetical protein Cfor_11191 [Coptotermes formosanus]|uniref:Uncharacterized protein n=1 Tax=Coptotermes formosanus TaxID=36987 RepID=A0A6L2PYS9_COPFO|nr:hypothetical protein Cfor_11191 [Coptotermes formosanus]
MLSRGKYRMIKSDAAQYVLASFCHVSNRSESINCYTCSSFNGSDPNCEDPYNPAMSTYREKCMVPKQGHIGTFPANFCIKIVGKNVETWELTVIRACVMKTMDTQCGMFRYQDDTMTGCILTCDYDGCNMASHFNPNRLLLGTAIIWLIFKHCI